MRIYHYTEMPEAVIGSEALGSKKRKLNDVESAVSTAMIEVAPGGHTLRHRHPYEHTMYIVEGTGDKISSKGWVAPTGSWDYPVWIDNGRLAFLSSTTSPPT